VVIGSEWTFSFGSSTRAIRAGGCRGTSLSGWRTGFD
jgi:hypothetical protein